MPFHRTPAHRTPAHRTRPLTAAETSMLRGRMLGGWWVIGLLVLIGWPLLFAFALLLLESLLDPVNHPSTMVIPFGASAALTAIITLVLLRCQLVWYRDLRGGIVEVRAGELRMIHGRYAPVVNGTALPFAPGSSAHLQPPGPYWIDMLAHSGKVLAVQPMDRPAPAHAPLSDDQVGATVVRDGQALSENRQGRLSQGQRMRLAYSVVFSAIAAACSPVLFGAGAHYTWEDSILLSLFFVVLGMLGCLGGLWVLRDQLGAVIEGTVERATGPIERIVLSTGRNRSIRFHVGDQSLDAYLARDTEPEPGRHYHVYFTPRGRSVVAIEPVADRAPD